MKLDIVKTNGGITSRQQLTLNKIMESDFEVRTLISSLFKQNRLDLLDNSKFVYRLINYAIFKAEIREVKNGSSK